MRKRNIAISTILIFAAILSVACFSACSDKETQGTAVAVFTEKTEYFWTGTPLALSPLFYEMADGTKKEASFDDFWFSNENGAVYFFEGHLNVTGELPLSFFETLTVYSKDNPALFVQIAVRSIDIPLTDFKIELPAGLDGCGQGSSVAIRPVFTPSYAPYRDYALTTDYPFAEVLGDKITLSKDAPVGDTFTVTALAHGGKTSSVTLKVMPVVPVSTAEDLDEIRNNPTAFYKLENDIDLAEGFKRWTPIPSFSGVFDGNGFSVKNLNVHVSMAEFKEEKSFGLFAVNDGVVLGLSLSDAKVAGDSQHEGEYAYSGIVAGTNNGTILGCGVYGSTLQVFRSKAYSGEIAGLNTEFGYIGDCTVAECEITGNGFLGGIAGFSSGPLRGCKTENTTFHISIEHLNSSVGGIVGYNDFGFLDKVSSDKLTMFLVSTNSILPENICPNFGYIAGATPNYYSSFSVADCIYEEKGANLSGQKFFEGGDKFFYHDQRIYTFNGFQAWHGKALAAADKG